MANLAGQKTFQSIVNEVGETAIRVSSIWTASGTFDPSLSRIQQMVNDAQREIASEYPWNWMFNTSTFNTVIGQQTPYALPDLCEEVQTMAIPASQTRLGQASWRDWVRVYPGRYTSVGNTRPWMYVPAPPAANNAKELYLFPASDKVYTVEIAFRQRVVDMAASGDLPLIPPEWQDVLVARAIYKAFKHLGDERMEFWDHNNPRSDAYLRYEKMWMENENKPDMVERFRSQEFEYAYTSFLDVNRMLFAGG